MHPLNASIFREYDIRGIVAEDLTDEAVKLIASAYATVFARENKKRLAVGMDGRPSSEHIKNLVIDTLCRYGLEVVDIGLVPTPLMYYAVFKMNLDGGLMITASHNPPEYNGVKALVGKESQAGDQIREIYELAVKGDFPPLKPGRSEKRDFIPDYLDYICRDIKLQKPIKVVIDGGNGTAGITAGPLYRRLGALVEEIYCDVDGRFPNHHPDPTNPKNLVDLIARVKETGADLGIGFDGDGDRLGVVDGQGHILWGDLLTLIFARDILVKIPGAKIISEVKASDVLYSEIERLGGQAIMWKAGHSLIKKKIVEENAALAGEVSGHIFFNDRWFGFDDAVYAGARLLEILSNTGESLGQMLATIPQMFNTPEIRVDTPDETKFKIVALVAAHFKKSFPVIDIDGARIKFPHGWALVRASNTQPSLVTRYEADSPEHLQDIQAIVGPVLERFAKEIDR